MQVKVQKSELFPVQATLTQSRAILDQALLSEAKHTIISYYIH